MVVVVGGGGGGRWMLFAVVVDGRERVAFCVGVVCLAGYLFFLHLIETWWVRERCEGVGELGA